MNRREFAQRLTTAAAFASAAAAEAQEKMNHPMPAKPEEIAMLIYPGMTALDLIGPQQVFGYLMGVKVHLVAKTAALVTSDTGVSIKPTSTFAAGTPQTAPPGVLAQMKQMYAPLAESARSVARQQHTASNS